MLINSHQFALDGDDMIKAIATSTKGRIALDFRGKDYSGDVYMSMTWLQARLLVDQIQTLIDAEFGPDETTNVVTLTPPSAA